jgi:hypothetical protein
MWQFRWSDLGSAETDCPENQGLAAWVEEGAESASEEAALLLRGVPLDQLPPRLLDKLEQWDLIDLLDGLPRNTKVLLEKAEQ